MRQWQKLGKPNLQFKSNDFAVLSATMSKYIVTLKENTSDDEANQIKQQIEQLGGKITQEYSLIKGFAAELPEVAASKVQSSPHVLLFEADQPVHTQ